MSDLSAFQDAFCAALDGHDSDLGEWTGGTGEAAAGLTVYRNTILKGAADCLAAAYETVVEIVGEAWFRAAAVAFARSHPPQTASMFAYGRNFPDWLEGFGPAQDLPYLTDVARIDWLRHEAWFAADADPLAAHTLTPETLARRRARLHPSVRLAAFDCNIVDLWLAHRHPEGLAHGFQLLDRAEHAVVFRTGPDVEVRRLDAPAHAFLKACAEGKSLLVAAERALDAAPDADLSRIVAEALESGLFTELVAA